MFDKIQTAIKIRIITVFMLVHTGLALGVYSLARASFNGWDQTSVVYLAGILCLYLGFLLGVFFVLGPIMPWVQRAKKVDHWIERVIHELPVLVDSLPKIIAAVQTIIALWNDSKRNQSKTES